MKYYLRLLALLSCFIFLTGCFEKEVDKMAAEIDRAIATMDRATYTFDQNASEGLGILSKALSVVSDGTIKKDVKETIDHLQQAAAKTPMQLYDFGRARIKEDLMELKAALLGKRPPVRVPYIASVSPITVQFTNSKENLLQLSGWNLQREIVMDGLDIKVKSGDTVRTLDKKVINSVTPYDLILRFTPGTESSLRRGDTQIIGEWKGNVVFEIPILAPLPTVEKDVTFTVPQMTTERASHKRGDKDLDSREGGRDRVSQRAHVWLRHDEGKVYCKIIAVFEQKIHDATLFEVDKGFKEIFRLLDHGSIVDNARRDLNLSREYDSAVLKIVNIVSDTEGFAGLNEEDHVMNQAGPVGCVEKFKFYGDGPGDDDNVKVEYELKPIVIRLAFRMPDEYVKVEISRGNALKLGIPLK